MIELDISLDDSYLSSPGGTRNSTSLLSDGSGIADFVLLESTCIGILSLTINDEDIGSIP